MINFSHIDSTRNEEIQRVLDRHADIFTNMDLLEIGSGTGLQLQELSRICKSAVGIEVADSSYADHRIMDIRQYDGQNIPFPDRSFDVIFSSHVLEHVKNESAIHREMHRVLRPNGMGIHIVPSHTWRLWTSLMHYPVLPVRVFDKVRRMTKRKEQDGGNEPVQQRQLSKKWLDFLTPPRHGEFGNRVSEHWLFHPSAWRRRIESYGWRIDVIEEMGLAYTGHGFWGTRMSMETRRRLSGVLGSSAILIILQQSQD